MFPIHISNSGGSPVQPDSSRLQAIFSGFRQQASLQIAPSKLFIPDKSLQRSLEEHVTADLPNSPKQG